MFHKAAIVLSIGLKPNPSKFMKTVALHDFYFGEKDFPYPMGGIQLVGSFKWEMMKGEAPPLTPPIVLKTMKISLRSLVAHDGRFAQPRKPRPLDRRERHPARLHAE